MNYLIEVLRSAAGYYIGQVDEDGFPFSRLSASYFATRGAANDAMCVGFAPKASAENLQLLEDLITNNRLEVVAGKQLLKTP